MKYFLTVNEGDLYSFSEYKTFFRATEAIKELVMTSGLPFNSFDLVYGEEIKFDENLNRLNDIPDLIDSTYFVRALSPFGKVGTVYVNLPTAVNVKIFLQDLHDLKNYKFKDMQVIYGIRLNLTLNIDVKPLTD